MTTVRRILNKDGALSSKGLPLAAVGVHKRHSNKTKHRIMLTMIGFACLYGVIGLRLVFLGQTDLTHAEVGVSAQDQIAQARPDVVDRHGKILATDVKTAALYAEPRRMVDPDEAAELISQALPELSSDNLRQRFSSNAGFVWVKREITPSQQRAIHDLGIPGIGFLSESRRFYPGANLASHVLGHVNVDNQGIAGIEKYIDQSGLHELHKLGFARTGEGVLRPVKLSLDLRVQHAVRDEIAKAIKLYRAIAGMGVLLNVHTGEILSMVSLPDYNPNRPSEALDPNHMNRVTAGVYEMGSIFKAFTTASALDSGQVHIDDSFDARQPIRVKSWTINDFHAKRRILSVPEVFIYSSNIGTARMALAMGREQQRSYLAKLGLTHRLSTELPERAKPILPRRWTELSSMTISFGHGLSTSPMQVAAATASLVNGGYYVPPTFIPRSRVQAMQLSKRVLQSKTSDLMRYLFRLNVERGSGRNAEVAGFRVGGKTGTAEKVVNGRYSRHTKLNSFLSAFPIDRPEYVLLVMLDEPKPAKGQPSATAGRNAAPTTRAIIERVAPMLGITPKHKSPKTQAIHVSY